MKLLLCFLAILTINLGLFSKQKIPLIYDSDGNIDDFLAFMLIKESNSIDLLAITTTGNGRTHSDYIGRNILDFLSQIGIQNIEVADKSCTSLSRVGFYPKNDRALCDNLSYISLKRTHSKTSNLLSHQLLIDKINASSQKVTIICSGPLTNLGLALLSKSSIKKNIERIYIIGGAITVPGNIETTFNGFLNSSAEYNIALDVKAAHIVLNSGLPITLIPLDLSNQLISIRSPLESALKKFPHSDDQKIISSLLKPKFFPQIQSGVTFSSVFGIFHILDPNFGTTIPIKLQINTVTGSQYGQLFVTPVGLSIDVCINVNKNIFKSLFLETLLHFK